MTVQRYWARQIPDDIAKRAQVVFAVDYDQLRTEMIATADENGRLRAALQGVIRVADRDTDEFNTARAALGLP